MKGSGQSLGMSLSGGEEVRLKLGLDWSEFNPD